MTTHFEEISYRIPAHFLPYLINGDASGLDDLEIDSIDRYLDSENLGEGHWSYDSEAESYFSHSNDLNNLGGDVVEISWMKRV